MSAQPTKRAALEMRAAAHREFVDELQRVAETLPLVNEQIPWHLQRPRVLDTLRSLRHSGEDSLSMATRFRRRATTVKGRPLKNECLRGLSEGELRWAADEYTTFAEELLWLVRRSVQRLRGGPSIDWRALPRPRYRNSDSLPNCFIVESASLKAERAHLSTCWTDHDELTALNVTLRDLIERHRTIQADCELGAAQIRPGRPIGSGSAKDRLSSDEKLKLRTGRRLANRIYVEIEIKRSATTKSKALHLIAKSEVEVTERRERTLFLKTSFGDAVGKKARSLGQSLSRWRSKIPTHEKERQGPPRRSLSEGATGSDLQANWNVWIAPLRPNDDEDGTT